MADSAVWTPLQLIRWTTGYFSDRRIEHARSEAELLLAHALGARRIDLYVHYDKPLAADELARFKDLVKRRLNREPVAYITGVREFWSMELTVNPSVLIPRPETECLVEAVLPFLAEPSDRPKQVLELGTGSGAVILALAKERPEHRYVAMDRSLKALRTARVNAGLHGLGRRIDWFCGDWLSALSPRAAGFDLIVSNPPYIPSAGVGGLQPEIRCFEPRLALDGHADGLFCLRQIIEGAFRHLASQGLLAVEIGEAQGAAVGAIAAALGRYASVEIKKDYSGFDRIALLSHGGS